MSSLKKQLVQLVDLARAKGRTVTTGASATADEISVLESRSGELPLEIRELLEYATGVTVDDMSVNFLGQHPFEFTAMFAHGVPIATDGEGNFWVVDVKSDGVWGVVFFVAHDPPVAIIQAPNVASFLEQMFSASDASAIKGDAISYIAARNPYVISREQALASSDAAVRVFAEEVGEDFAIADIRDGAPGKGFVWGSAGPNAAVRRAGEVLLFAIEQKKRSLFRRLFSG